MQQLYPRCNSQRGIKVRDKVWCTNKSGGVERDWIGVPRLFRDSTQNNRVRCACVKPSEADNPVLFQEYDNCDPDEHECLLDDPDEKSEL